MPGGVNRHVVLNGNAHHVAKQPGKRRAYNLAAPGFHSQAEAGHKCTAVLHKVSDPRSLCFCQYVSQWGKHDLVRRQIRARRDHIDSRVAGRDCAVPGRYLRHVTEPRMPWLNLEGPSAIVVKYKGHVRRIARIQQLQTQSFQFLHRLLDLVIGRTL